MKVLKYIAASLVALVGFNSCSSDYLDTEYTTYLGEKEAAAAAASNPDVFLNGIWSQMVAYEGEHDRYGYLSWLMFLQVMGEDMAHENGQTYYNFDYQMDYREEQWVRTRLIWQGFYSLIDKANAIISLYPEGGANVNEKGLLGQAFGTKTEPLRRRLLVFLFTLIPQMASLLRKLPQLKAVTLSDLFWSRQVRIWRRLWNC